ncbi:hypothetical protein pMIN27_79 [Escherichia phage Min27]|uniref:Uncharacterized protein ORF82 n=1 Tax=Escherichia phage Min27 TaxID=489779 RepID=B0FEH8_9CAUD|nr:hypothetical protein pMIN27_79 [Escherichia phage Min27]ABY49932.1 hypothetical protein [Escherichia phage Min27]
MCSAWIEPQINVKRLAGRVMLTGAFLYLPLVFMPEADSLKHPQQFHLTLLFPQTVFISSDKSNTQPAPPPLLFLHLRMLQARSLIHLLLNIFKVIFRIQYCSSCCPQPCFGVLFFTLEAGNRFSELIVSVMKLSNLSHHSLTIVRTPQNILKRVHNTSALQAQDNVILFMNLNGPMLTALLWCSFFCQLL